MKKTMLLACLLLLVASVASAQNRGRLQLAWDECNGMGGSNIRTFACATNSNSAVNVHNLVGSYVCDNNGLPGLISWASSIDLKFEGGPVPPWWQHGATDCRGTANVVVAFTNPTGATCLDYESLVAGGALGGNQYLWGAGVGMPDHAQLRTVAAVDGSANHPDIPGNTEIYLFTATFRNGATTGAGSCAGCPLGASLTIYRTDFEQDNADNFSVVYSNAYEAPPAPLRPDQACARWQPSGEAVCMGATPTNNSTWGHIKSIYR